MSKPIRIFYSTMTNRFYASSHYKIGQTLVDGRSQVVITGEKFDVTNQIGSLVEEHEIEFSRAPAPPANPTGEP